MIAAASRPSAGREDDMRAINYPQSTISADLGRPSLAMRTVQVNAGEDLQAAVERARDGDELVLEAGATFVGPIYLPHRPGSGWLTIRSAWSGDPGVRARPSDGRARILAGGSPLAAIVTGPRSRHVWFRDVELTTGPGEFSMGLIRLGTGQETERAQLPHHFAFERCHVHGDAVLGGRRGIVLNAHHVMVLDSWLSDWKEDGADSQAVAGWNGPGPFWIQNCHLEAAGENVMFGGADPKIPGLIPSDIVIEGCHFFKPEAWRDASWTVKNLLETKNARRVRVLGNVFEGCWPAAQAGYAINVKSANQDGTAPQSISEDVAIMGNVFVACAGGLNVSGISDQPGGVTRRVEFAENDLSLVGADCAVVQVLSGARDVTIHRNTAVNDGSALSADGAPSPRLAFFGNLMDRGAYGVKGSGRAEGMSSIAGYFPGAVFECNTLVGADAALYPTGNCYPPSRDDLTSCDLACEAGATIDAAEVFARVVAG